MLGIMVACAVFLAVLVPLMNSGHVVLEILTKFRNEGIVE